MKNGTNLTRSLVERPALGSAPTGFRVWAHGPNELDGKTVVFSERSAELLLAEQAARGRLYSFDFDHRSVLPDSSPEAGKAAGWHTLEVRQDERGKPELWATSCDWTGEARAGLEADPPEWRYFSPCFDADPKTREVTSYVNCALTNNPLTHGIPALASSVGRPAKKKAAMATLLTKIDDLSKRIAKAEKAFAPRVRTPTDHVVQMIELAGRNALRSIKHKAEMASALARVKALTARAAKLEKASALRASAQTEDRFFSEALDRAERNVLRNLSHKAEGVADDALSIAVLAF